MLALTVLSAFGPLECIHRWAFTTSRALHKRLGIHKRTARPPPSSCPQHGLSRGEHPDSTGTPSAVWGEARAGEGMFAGGELSSWWWE